MAITEPGMAAKSKQEAVGGGREVSSAGPDGSSLEKGEKAEVEWKPGKQEYAVMLTLAVISLMVALDATILVSVLPVRLSLPPSGALLRGKQRS
jgi:hypothetical protein